MDAVTKKEWLPKLPDNANWIAHALGVTIGLAVQILIAAPSTSLLLAVFALLVSGTLAMLTGEFLTMPISPVPSYLIYILARGIFVAVAAHMSWTRFLVLLTSGTSGS